MKKRDLNHCVSVYRELLTQKDIQVAYTELIKYVQRLKTTLSRNLSHEYSFGNVFQGYMDYTYFYFSNEYLRKKKLKFGLVLNHRDMKFEVWLLGQTKSIQAKYWQLFKNTKWIKNSEMPLYSVLEVSLIESPNFNNLDLLTETIKSKLILVVDEITDSIEWVEW